MTIRTIIKTETKGMNADEGPFLGEVRLIQAGEMIELILIKRLLCKRYNGLKCVEISA
jgi:hypothetical protein